MPDNPYNLKDMSDLELYGWVAGWQQSTAQYIAGQQEIRRRNESGASRRSRIAMVISGLALLVALISLFV